MYRVLVFMASEAQSDYGGAPMPTSHRGTGLPSFSQCCVSCDSGKWEVIHSSVPTSVPGSLILSQNFPLLM